MVMNDNQRALKNIRAKIRRLCELIDKRGGPLRNPWLCHSLRQAGAVEKILVERAAWLKQTSR